MLLRASQHCLVLCFAGSIVTPQEDMHGDAGSVSLLQARRVSVIADDCDNFGVKATFIDLINERL